MAETLRVRQQAAKRAATKKVLRGVRTATGKRVVEGSRGRKRSATQGVGDPTLDVLQGPMKSVIQVAFSKRLRDTA